ncbi:hypothetical protein ACW9YQ_27840 (plasmid) [Paraburkholderia strydomiana]
MKKLFAVVSIAGVVCVGLAAAYGPEALQRYRANQEIEESVKHCTDLAVQRSVGIDPSATRVVFEAIYNECMDGNRQGWLEVKRLQRLYVK